MSAGGSELFVIRGVVLSSDCLPLIPKAETIKNVRMLDSI